MRGLGAIPLDGLQPRVLGSADLTDMFPLWSDGSMRVREWPMPAINGTRSLKRYSIGALILIVIAWIIYALAGGPTAPERTGASPPGQEP